MFSKGALLPKGASAVPRNPRSDREGPKLAQPLTTLPAAPPRCRYQAGNMEPQQRHWSECKRYYLQAAHVYPQGKAAAYGLAAKWPGGNKILKIIIN
jgi:hypothetical protein